MTIKCSHCSKPEREWGGKGVLLTCDGDFACGEECKRAYEAKRDHFFNNILPDDRLFAEWFVEGVSGEKRKIIFDLIKGNK